MADDRPRKMTEDELKAHVITDFEEGMGREGGDIAGERATALAYYLSKPFDDVEEGESSFVTATVEEVIDSIMPNLLRMFTTADNLINFDPVGAEDEPQAKQESDVVNHAFFKENDAFLILYDWFFTALVQKNGYVQAYWDERERIGQETYENLLPFELSQLLEDDELEPEEQMEKTIEVPNPAGDGMVTTKAIDVVFRRVSKRGKLTVEGVPPEEIRISSDCTSVIPRDARFVGRERNMTRSQLVDMGFPKEKVWSLPAVEIVDDSSEAAERKDKDDEREDGSPDKSQEMIFVQEGYPLIDFDGDGRSERRHVIIAGGELLENEVVDRHPYHTLCPQPLPFKHHGRSTAEKMINQQRLESTLVRGALNNIYHTNKPGTAVWEQAMGENTLDDLLTVRVGRIARFTRPVNEAMSPMTIPYTAGPTFQMLGWLDQQKKERTGISVDTQGLDPDSLKHVQKSVMSDATDMGRMKIEVIARVFAETGIKELFLHIHEILQKHQDKEKTYKIRNEWVPVKPSTWRTRYDMTVNIGLGIGTREQNRAVLQGIGELQKAIIDAGGWGTLVTPMNVYNMAAETVRNANFKSPELFFTPSEEVSPPNDQQQQLMAKEQELRAEQQKLDAERQMNAAQKIKLDAQEMVLNARAKSRELDLKAEDIDRKRQKDRDDIMVALENVSNELMEMRLKYSGDGAGAQQ